MQPRMIQPITGVCLLVCVDLELSVFDQFGLLLPHGNKTQAIGT